MKKFLTILFVLCFSHFFLQAQNTIYVNAASTDASPDGSSWAKAFKGFQEGINATVEGDQVFIAQGTYQPLTGVSFSLKKNVKIYGGFPASGNPTMSERNWTSFPTILKGNNNSVIRNDNNSVNIGTVLDGFFITGGNAAKGGGIYNSKVSPTLTNLKIFQNTATDGGGGIMNTNYSNPVLSNVLIEENTSNTYGGGIHNYSTAITLNNVTIRKNTAEKGGAGLFLSNTIVTGTNIVISENSAKKGAGVYCNDSTLNLKKSTIAQNIATEEGGGIYADRYRDTSASIILEEVKVANNEAIAEGGGIFLYSNQLYPTEMAILTNSFLTGNESFTFGGGLASDHSMYILTNVLFNKNTASMGGGIYNNNVNPELTNVTIADNSVTQLGAPMFNQSSSFPILYHCVILGNSLEIVNANGSGLNSLSSGNLIQVNGVNSGANSTGTGTTVFPNSTKDDIFMNFSASDYSLKPNSWVVNTGNNTLYSGANGPNKDIMGNPRIVQGTIDLGAYEYQGVLAINENSTNPKLQIFPNPARETLTVRLSESDSQSYEIYSNTGQLVKKGNINGKETKIELQNLPSGVYLLKTQDQQGIKFIKK